MVNRRPMGALEDQVMDYLWMIDDPVTPSEVHEAVAPELAYTTVMTVLSRLFDKGRLERNALERRDWLAVVLLRVDGACDIDAGRHDVDHVPDAAIPLTLA